MVIALANMTPERISTMMEALPRMLTNFLTKNCPKNPASTETDVRYIAAIIRKTSDTELQIHSY